MKNKRKKGIAVPGDNVGRLIALYIVLAAILTGFISSRIFFGRFQTYLEDRGEETCVTVSMSGIFHGEETLGLAMNNVFIGTTVFILFCILMIARNYYYFHKDSKSIYLMKRLPDSFEIHGRCLTLPLLAILFDIVLTALLTYVYYSYYCKYIGHDCYFSLWEALL